MKSGKPPSKILMFIFPNGGLFGLCVASMLASTGAKCAVEMNAKLFWTHKVYLTLKQKMCQHQNSKTSIEQGSQVAPPVCWIRTWVNPGPRVPVNREHSEETDGFMEEQNTG